MQASASQTLWAVNGLVNPMFHDSGIELLGIYNYSISINIISPASETGQA